MTIEDLVPDTAPMERRVEMTLSCHDCDAVPKVEEAGTVQVLPDGRKIQIMHNGVRVIAGGYHGDWNQRLIELARGHHEPQEERIFHEIVQRLPPDATMIELGGYWLYYSLWFLKDAPDRRAFCVEPDTANLEIGRINAELNGRSIEFVHAYVGATSLPPAPFPTERSGLIELPCVTVPELLDRWGLDHLTLLHCDVQGAETDVLESSSRLLASGRIEWVVVSTHAHQISGDPLTHHRCLDILQRSGMTIIAEHEVHESFSGDGLIVARAGGYPSDWPAIPLSRNRYSQSLFRNPLYDLAVTCRNLKAATSRAEGEEKRAEDAEARHAAAEARHAAAEARHAAAEEHLAAIQGELRDARRDAAELRSSLAAERAAIAALRASTSWRITGPFRRLVTALRRPTS